MGLEKYYPSSGPSIHPCQWPNWPHSFGPAEIHINLPGSLPVCWVLVIFRRRFPPPPFRSIHSAQFIALPSFFPSFPLPSSILGPAPFGLFPFGPLVIFFWYSLPSSF